MGGMSSKVYIAGLGVISAIGNNATECLAALQSGRDGLGEVTLLPTVHRNEIPVAEIRQTNEQLAQQSGFETWVSRTIHLSSIAAQEALSDSGIKNLDGLLIGFISANTVGGIDKSEHFYEDFLKDPEHGGDLLEIVNHGCGNITELVADHLGISE